jgi:hypothetical protein
VTSTWTAATIRIAIWAGARRWAEMVEAEVWKHWAIHPPYKAAHAGYDVTHVPTGLTVNQEHFSTRRAAERFAEYLDPLADDWGRVRPGGAGPGPSLLRQIRAAEREIERALTAEVRS